MVPVSYATDVTDAIDTMSLIYHVTDTTTDTIGAPPKVIDDKKRN